jgi:triphosphatase
MSPPREIELKLDVPADTLPLLTASSLLKGASKPMTKPANPVSVYFDTDKLKLRQRGLSLRVRRLGRNHVQTIKQKNNGNVALFARGQWEHNVRAKQPDLEAARGTALAPLLNKKLRRALKPVFQTRVNRKVFQIHAGESEVELTIDDGRVESGRKSSPLCEVELELKQGQAADLFKLAKTLAHEVPVQLAIKSKADRGYALLTAEKAAPVKARPVAYAAESDVQSAFQSRDLGVGPSQCTPSAAPAAAAPIMNFRRGMYKSEREGCFRCRLVHGLVSRSLPELLMGVSLRRLAPTCSIGRLALARWAYIRRSRRA